jgi:methylenetetrahydrofolate dehydrogenase (NADP+)/methenyltetrahydrofolate cyclohydrolase
MPAVVKAIKKIVEFATKDLAYFGKKASVVGAGGNVGRRTVEMLSKIGYKVTECDQETRDLYAKLNGVDLIVSATGVPNLIKGEMIKEGAIAIDVGSPRGDFDFDSVSPRAGFITPVPGGVGPLTVVSLLENLVEKV